jgi:NADH-quinone oxidoreductase subunit J
MTPAFIAIAALTVASAIAAMSLRHLVHCALCGALTFGGLAALFLQLDAQFVGFAQLLVYVGAVAILVVFAILLTRGGDEPGQTLFSHSWWAGLAVALLVWISLVLAVLSSPVTGPPKSTPGAVASAATVQRIGTTLMTEFVLPLEILALLLTAATLGAVIIAMQDKEVPK